MHREKITNDFYVKYTNIDMLGKKVTHTFEKQTHEKNQNLADTNSFQLTSSLL